MHPTYDRIRRSFDRLDTSGFDTVHCIDMHTGGEPLRVILSGTPPIIAKTVLDHRRIMRDEYDEFRTALMWEPRGHADMYGAVIIPPERQDSAFGVLFLHNEGYSTMCGHATIAIGKLAIEMGWVEAQEPLTRFRIDAPCGQLTCMVRVKKGRVKHAAFVNVPSFVCELDAETTLEDGSTVKYDLAYGGAFYAFVDAQQFGVPILPENARFFIDKGREVKAAVTRSSDKIVHPGKPELSYLYGTIFIEPSEKEGIHSRNVCMFADGEIDRSPTGSGVSARAAIHHARAEFLTGEKYRIESIIGSTMDVEVLDMTTIPGGRPAIIPKVSGKAWITGQHTFLIDPDDPWGEGFLLAR